MKPHPCKKSMASLATVRYCNCRRYFTNNWTILTTTHSLKGEYSSFKIFQQYLQPITGYHFRKTSKHQPLSLFPFLNSSNFCRSFYVLHFLLKRKNVLLFLTPQADLPLKHQDIKLFFKTTDGKFFFTHFFKSFIFEKSMLFIVFRASSVAYLLLFHSF